MTASKIIKPLRPSTFGKRLLSCIDAKIIAISGKIKPQKIRLNDLAIDLVRICYFYMLPIPFRSHLTFTLQLIKSFNSIDLYTFISI